MEEMYIKVNPTEFLCDTQDGLRRRRKTDSVTFADVDRFP